MATRDDPAAFKASEAAYFGWAQAVKDAVRQSTRDEDPHRTPNPLPLANVKPADPLVDGLSTIVRQLNDLWIGPENDEYGRLRPAPNAFARAVHILVDAAIELFTSDRVFPFGCASTDSRGGVRVEWVRDVVSVHLVTLASPGQEAYIYHELGANYGTEDAVPGRLAHWLREVG